MPFSGMTRLLAGLATPLLALGLTAGAAQAADRAIIVLDASGSMWGQIDGKAKISIARETLSRVLGGIPADLELGLIAYGHRQKGECSDIELIVPAGPGTADKISRAVDGLKPKGKTPLTDSVRQAAEALKYTEDKATVILITDGLETCDADPCALGKMLEETGVDFTAHVVGFGLSEKEGREVACLANETGGVYLSAGNADELVEALDKTVAAAPPEPPKPVLPEASLTAEPAIPVAANLTIGWEGPGEKNDKIEIFDPEALAGDGRKVRDIKVRSGDFDNRKVVMPAPGRDGRYLLRYWSAEHKTYLAEREIEVVPAEVTLSVTPPVTAGKTITVEWTGPGARHDSIQLWDPQALNGEGKRLFDKRVRSDDFDNRTVTMPTPAEGGTYELRYWNADNRMVLATTAVEVEDVAVSLEAPETISAGATLRVKWEGPGARYDEIRLWDPNARGGDGQRVFNKRVRADDFENQTVKMPAPASPGTYELQYWQGDNRVIMATRPIEVVAVAVTLQHPVEIDAGATLRVKWEGPGARYDEVQLWDPNAKGGDGKRLFNKRVRNDDFENKTVSMPAPAEPGQYELRYYNGDSREVMTVSFLVVREVAVTLDAPDQIGQGAMLTVGWQGPGARYDEVQLWDPNAGSKGKRLFNKRVRNDDFDNRRASMPVPTKPGTYELRYYNGDSRMVMATRKIEVVPIEIGLEGPEAVEPETRFAVTWKGPGARYDEVQIVDASGKKVASKRLRNDDFENNKVTLKAPKAPGEYVLRYYNGDNRAVLAERSLSVN